MKGPEINWMTFRKIMIALAIGLISVFVSMLQLETYSLSKIIDSTKLFWAYVNILPLAIAFFVKHYGHEINFFVYYLAVFVQWFLLTLFFFRLKGLVRGRKGFRHNQE
jgi:O-antigen/teichoic acid export membrane protein